MQFEMSGTGAEKDKTAPCMPCTAKREAEHGKRDDERQAAGSRMADPEARDEDVLQGFDAAVATWEPLWESALDQGVARHGTIADLPLKDCILDTVSRRADKVHLRYCGRTWTFKESNDVACRLANALMEKGQHKGQRALVMLADTPELVFTFMACYKIGLIAVGLDPRSTAAEVQANLADNQATAAFVDAVNAPVLASALADGNTSVETVVVVPDNAGAPDNAGVPASGDDPSDRGLAPLWFRFDELVEPSSGGEPPVAVDADDPAVIIYTGGTTGVSKGCPLSNRALVQASHLFTRNLVPVLPDADHLAMLSTSPMVHAYGLDLGVNWGLVSGAEVIIADKLDAETIMDLIENCRPAVWGAVPALINKINNDERARRCDFSALRVVIMSCAISAYDIVKQFKQISGAHIVEDYGMTETAGPVSLTPVLCEGKEASIGVPTQDTDILVVDLETGMHPLASGQRGQIVFRGPQVMKEYWHAPEESRNARRGAWFYSGDMGYFDEDGFLYIVDRIKDMICVGGFSVFPREIDEVLFAHPKVLDVCTIGVADARSGERPKSFVVKKPGCCLSEKEVIDYCHERLIAYKCPRYVEFIDAIPHTRLNKPDRKSLRKMEQEK